MSDTNVDGRPDQEALFTPPKSTWWRRAVGLIWDSVEGDARNRRYVQKLDTFLLSVFHTRADVDDQLIFVLSKLAHTSALDTLSSISTSRIIVSLADKKCPTRVLMSWSGNAFVSGMQEDVSRAHRVPPLPKNPLGPSVWHSLSMHDHLTSQLTVKHVK